MSTHTHTQKKKKKNSHFCIGGGGESSYFWVSNVGSYIIPRNWVKKCHNVPWNIFNSTAQLISRIENSISSKDGRIYFYLLVAKFLSWGRKLFESSTALKAIENKKWDSGIYLLLDFWLSNNSEILYHSSLNKLFRCFDLIVRCSVPPPPFLFFVFSPCV